MEDPGQEFVAVLDQHATTSFFGLECRHHNKRTANSSGTAYHRDGMGLPPLTIFRPRMYFFLKALLSLREDSLWPVITGRWERIVVQGEEDSAGVLCCRPDGSKDTWMIPIALQSPLNHHGLDSSPQFFMLSGIVAFCPLKPLQMFTREIRGLRVSETINP